MAFNKSAYDQQYAKEHVTRKYLAFNKDDPQDTELLLYLRSKPNMNAYVKQLIRDDMEREKALFNADS